MHFHRSCAVSPSNLQGLLSGKALVDRIPKVAYQFVWRQHHSKVSTFDNRGIRHCAFKGLGGNSIAEAVVASLRPG